MLVKKILNKVSTTVNIARLIISFRTSDEIDITRLLSMLNCHGCAKITLKYKDNEAYLLIYQHARSEPDYTIKVK